MGQFWVEAGEYQYMLGSWDEAREPCGNHYKQWKTIHLKIKDLQEILFGHHGLSVSENARLSVALVTVLVQACDKTVCSQVSTPDLHICFGSMSQCT